MSSSQQCVTFKNGQKMPFIGLGTWLSDNASDVEDSVDSALKAGYRHIDTAYFYCNEEGIGKTLKKWFDSGKLKREDVYITTKLPVNGIRADLVEHFLKLSLKNLQLDYVDLYLIHSPFALKYISDKELFPRDSKGNALLDTTTNLEEVWKAMEIQQQAGLAKSIGVSNFNSKQLERIIKIAKIPPVNIQVELHLYFQQKKLRELCAKHKIIVTAYAPLGSTGRPSNMGQVTHRVIDDPVVQELAAKYKKKPAQILLRFLVQSNIMAIPKSTNAGRIKENIEIFDFELEKSDMERLSAQDKGKDGRTFYMKDFEKHPEYTWNEYDG